MIYGLLHSQPPGSHRAFAWRKRAGWHTIRVWRAKPCHGAAVHSDEQENADGDLNFVDKAQQQTASAVFDDKLIMLSPKVLIQQMVQAQRLP